MSTPPTVTSLDIRRAASIYGWMSEPELQWLAQQALDHLLIVEIGSYLGRSTRALADNTLGKVVAIDDWLGADSDARPVPPEKGERLFHEFKTNLEDHIRSGVVVPCKCDHGKGLNIIIRPDMVFIDGDHSYEGVKRDINIWLPRLKPGGLLCGHDFNAPSVGTAVRELLPEAQSAADTIWQYTKGVTV